MSKQAGIHVFGVLATIAFTVSATASVKLPEGMTREQAAAIGIVVPEEPAAASAVPAAAPTKAPLPPQRGDTKPRASGAAKPAPKKPPRDFPVIRAAPNAAPDAPLIMGPYSGADIVPDQVLFFADLPQDRLRAIAARNGLTVLAISPLDNLGVAMVHARLPYGTSPQAAIDQLERDQSIAWAQPNHIYWLLGNSREKGLAMHGLTPPASGAVSGRIVMIDSPVDEGNAALAGARLSQQVFGSTSAPAAHGTAIAEILVGTGAFPGVAQGAELVSLAAFSKDSKGDWYGYTPDLARALDAAIALGPNVANLSFATRDHDKVVGKLIEKLDQSGTCIAAAAGNDPHYSVLFPGRLDVTLAVTAIDERQRIYTNASRGEKVDIAAWGVGMNAAVPGGRRNVTGTSFATAIVSGSMLRMPACNGGRAPAAMRAAIRSDALDLGEPGTDFTFGAGLFTLGQASLAPVAASAAAARRGPEVADNSWAVVSLAGAVMAVFAAILLLLWRRRRQDQRSD
ncbi:MAG: S8 family serine peptidase [Sphingomonadaceae bacterium]|nr:S8 family serine peptidase [Sphingomonadaceae bacterium]